MKSKYENNSLPEHWYIHNDKSNKATEIIKYLSIFGYNSTAYYEGSGKYYGISKMRTSYKGVYCCNKSKTFEGSKHLTVEEAYNMLTSNTQLNYEIY